MHVTMKDLMEKDETIWAQRSKMAWLNDKDRNTKYFHLKASYRKKNNNIKHIKNKRGVWDANEEGIAICSSIISLIFLFL